ncbi:MAG TPA: hypothetical protein VNE62_03225 [Actinomycetota bacterium]|nr:hypothetical protein [Actinomycetota bacterium]
MTLRRTLIALVAAALMAVPAAPAFAHHDPDGRHDAQGCSTHPSRDDHQIVSGWTVHAEDGHAGIQWTDGYVTVDASPDSGVTVTAFVPWWDRSGPTQGPHWVDLKVTVGPNPSACNETRTVN